MRVSGNRVDTVSCLRQLVPMSQPDTITWKKGRVIGARTQHRQMDEIDDADLLRFTQHTAWLMEARIAAAEVLALLGKHPGTMAPIATELAEKSRLGISLSDAMRAYPYAFSDSYRATVRAGEHADTLAASFDSLADELRLTMSSGSGFSAGSARSESPTATRTLRGGIAPPFRHARAEASTVQAPHGRVLPHRPSLVARRDGTT